MEVLLTEMKQEKKTIRKIVLTGGPCAGKTTAMSWIQNIFTERGYSVLFIPETATELISNGIAPWTCLTNVDYQKFQFELQMNKEKVFMNAARQMKSNKVLVICDRGLMDNKAYMNELEFQNVLNEKNLNEIDVRDRYDAVFHLVTAAKGAEEAYTLSNNQARTESVEEAAILDDKLISSWTGHSHFRVIDNSTDFEDKMHRLIKEISAFLGEPEPFEIERKYLIQYPNLKLLESMPNCQKVEIMQTYLNSRQGEEIRVRQRGLNGNYIYFKTTKKMLSGLKRIETEERLSREQYLKFLMDADTSCKPIRKTRYCLTYESQYFEIDIYPFWDDKAIVEIELSDESEMIQFPKFIKVIKEVTEDISYKNYSLAKQ